MAGNIPFSSKVKTGKNTVIEYLEDDVDELPDPYFSKSTTIIFDKIDTMKDGVLPLSKFVDLIETLEEGFHSEDMEDRMWKEDPNEIVSLERFLFEVVCEQGGLSGLCRGGRTFGGLGLQGQPDGFQREIFLKIHALKREREKQRLSLKEGSSLQPLRQESSLTE